MGLIKSARVSNMSGMISYSMSIDNKSGKVSNRQDSIRKKLNQLAEWYHIATKMVKTSQEGSQILQVHSQTSQKSFKNVSARVSDISGRA